MIEFLFKTCEYKGIDPSGANKFRIKYGNNLVKNFIGQIEDKDFAKKIFIKYLTLILLFTTGNFGRLMSFLGGNRDFHQILYNAYTAIPGMRIPKDTYCIQEIVFPSEVICVCSTNMVSPKITAAFNKL